MKHNYTIEELTKTGIYKITCIVNNKFYIGSASCTEATTSKKGFLGRLNKHISSLRNSKHHNLILQNSYNKYGEENFNFEIIEFCKKEDCLTREQYYLDLLQPFYPIGFNICKNSLCNYNITPKIRTYTRDNSNINNQSKVTVVQKDLNNNILNEFIGIANAARQTSTHRVAIYKCCRKEYKTAGGFIWEYKNPEDNKPFIKTPKFNVKVTNLVTNEINIYKTILETSKNIDYCKSTILIHIRNFSPIENKYFIEKIFL